MPFMPMAGAMFLAFYSFGGSAFVNPKIQQMISGTPSKPRIKTGREFQLGNSSSTLTPYSVVYGTCRVGANRVFVHSAGSNNKWLNLVYTWSEGPCDSIDTDGTGDIIYLDDERVQYYETYKGKDLVEHSFHSGTGTQAVGTIVNDSEKGNTSWNDLYRWVCYSEFRFRWEATAWSQLPTATCVLNGRKLYDPRTSSYAWSDNGALVWLDWMTNRRYGGRIPFSIIDLDSVEDAANEVDGYGWKFNGVIYERESFGDILKNIEDSFRATHYWSNGKYYLKILKYETPSTTVTEGDVDSLPNRFNINQGGISETPDRALIYFADPDDNYTEKSVLINMTGIVSEGIDDNPLEIRLVGVADYQLAFDLGAYHLKRARASESYGPLNLKPKYGVLDPTDTVQTTHSFPGFSAKEMRVQSMGRRQAGGIVPVTFIEESSDIYTGSGVTVAAHNPYQSTLPDANANGEEPTNLEAETGPDELTANVHDAYVIFEWDNMGPYDYHLRWRKHTDKAWKRDRINVPYGEVESPVYVTLTNPELSAKSRGDFYGTTDVNYVFEIDGAGTPNTFKWSDDGGATWDDTLEPITANYITIEDGLEIKFRNTIGWTVGDRFTVYCKGTGTKVSHRIGKIECGEDIYWGVQSIDKNGNRSDWAIPDEFITTWKPATPSMAWYVPSVTPVKQGKQLSVSWSDWEGYGERVQFAQLFDAPAVRTTYTNEANDNTANDVYLLPAAPAVNDGFLLSSKYPFMKCFFNISTRGIGTWTITWYYYSSSGTWAAFSNVIDNTKGFTVGGEKSVSWSYPSDWIIRDLSEWTEGKKGYEIYAKVTAFTAMTQTPIARQIRIQNITVKDYDIFCSTTAPCPIVDDNIVGHNIKQSPFKFPWPRKTAYDVRVRPNGWFEPGEASETGTMDTADVTIAHSATLPTLS